MNIKIRRKAFRANIHRPYKKVKPILWITAGVMGLNRDQAAEYSRKILSQVDDMNSEYHIILTPTAKHVEVEMVVL